MDMEKEISFNETEEIRKLLTKHGVRPRQQMNFIAELLGLEYVSIQQKFSGKRAWTSDQLALIAKYFKEPLSTLTNERSIIRWNAILKINDIPQRCFIQRGTELAAAEFENLVAIRDNDSWFVVPGTKVKQGQTCFKILKMDVLPQPRVAALDDNPDITDTIMTMFGWHGVEVMQFQNVKPMLEAAKEQPFDGYILDWMLSKFETVESAIHHIREVLKSEVPITILTGELRTNDDNQSDIARMVEYFDVSVLEKPVVLEILVKSFSKSFFVTPSVISI
jgi:CheY-like chemotaxis protein